MAVNGTKIQLYFGGLPFWQGTSNDESYKDDLREITSKQSGGWAEFAPGKKSGSGSAEGLFTEVPFNLASFSEDLSNAIWVKSGCTVSANNSFGPNSKKTACLVSTFSNGDSILQTIDGDEYNASATEYTFSVWLKGTIGQTVTLHISDSAGDQELQVTLSASLVRYSVTYTTDGDDSDIVFGIKNISDTATSFTVAQAQTEEGPTATMYRESGFSYSTLFDAWKNATVLNMLIGSWETGSKNYTASAVITDLSRTAGDNDNVTYSISYNISGEVTASTTIS